MKAFCLFLILGSFMGISKSYAQDPDYFSCGCDDTFSGCSSELYSDEMDFSSDLQNNFGGNYASVSPADSEEMAAESNAYGINAAPFCSVAGTKGIGQSWLILTQAGADSYNRYYNSHKSVGDMVDGKLDSTTTYGGITFDTHGCSGPS
jgi:hypothetical protein